MAATDNEMGKMGVQTNDRTGISWGSQNDDKKMLLLSMKLKTPNNKTENCVFFDSTVSNDLFDHLELKGQVNPLVFNYCVSFDYLCPSLVTSITEISVATPPNETF